MSNTKKHKDHGKCNNGFLEKIPEYLRKTWYRSNWNIGEFRKNKKDLEDKIAEKELRNYISDLIQETPNDLKLGEVIIRFFS